MAAVTWALLCGAAFLAGGINAIAGGGTFFTFPALVFSGTGALQANATSTIALWPGSVASAWGYRDVLRTRPRALGALVTVSLVGGLVGATAAMHTDTATFERVVPFLVGFGALLFTVGDPLRRRIAKLGQPPAWVVVAAQVPISVYGGYLGGGIGLLMLASLTLLEGADLHRLNGLKSVLGLAINLTATAAFIVSGLVEWPQALAMAVAATVGGYVTARVAQRFDVKVVKRVVIVIGWVMTAIFFARAFR